MATLQKIRSKGALLIIIIGIALFAFIAEEAFRSIQSSNNESKQRIGEIYGDHISVQEFQNLVDEYSEAAKFTSGQTSLTDEQLTQIRDQVWNAYISNQLISHEAEKLGLTVTDAEIQSILAQGTNQLLLQTPFRNEKTGLFDINQLRKFLTDYEAMQGKSEQVPQQYMEYYQSLFKFWSFVEKTLREQTLAQKYEALLARTFISNPVEAKMTFNDRTTESNLMLTALPYASIKDNSIKVTDEDLKAKYNEEKEKYRQYVETRDIKYIDVAVTASTADKNELNKEMADYNKRLAEGKNIAALIKESSSTVNYTDVPLSKNAFPTDIAAQLDSMSAGVQKGPYYNAADNSMNIIRLISKEQAPDSIQCRVIQVGGSDVKAARASADSVYKALKGGADFEAVAKKYGQKGDKTWVTSKQYEGSSIDADNAKYLTALNNTAVNELSNIEFTQGNIIMQVTDRKAMTTKYVAAVVKRPIQFSKDTYKSAYNAFSQFVASNPTAQSIEANAAKKGYKVQERKDLASSEHYVGGVQNTRDAMKWVFDDGTDLNTVSPLYECGDNDHMMVVILTGVHKEGYRDINSVRDILKAEVLRDKKADLLMGKLKSVKSIAQAKSIPGALTDSLNHVTFSASAFVTMTNASEPALSGSVAKAKVGSFSGPVKGNAGVYVYQVMSRNRTAEKFDERKEEMQDAEMNMRGAGRFMNDLFLKANVKDKRYLFF